MLNYELKIKDIRKKKRVSQKKLAKELNTSQQQISRYETYDDIPSITRLVEIALILGVSLGELVEIKKIHQQYSKDMYEIMKKNNLTGGHLCEQ